METTTKWGRKDTAHLFTHTPFGDVEMYDFEKTGSEMFTIWLRVFSDKAEYNTMDILWRNCHANDAKAYFGIERNEQRMERS
jgi:hypothetical protein